MNSDRETLAAAVSAARQAAGCSCECYGRLLSHAKADDLYSVLEGQLRIAAQLAKLQNELSDG